ncbi:MAG TPA: glycosyltransferase [Candidatus Andersenbacteria bacterium]|nr:glycosyltransferase [Candidatus Andersenbacteria bacterium]
MRIGIDAHIILPEHKRYDPKIARYTEQVIQRLLAADLQRQHTWVLFFDERMQDTKKFEGPNVEIKHFPFVQYRKFLPVVYSHMLVSSFLAAARLDVFHSPEGLIPYIYPGKIVSTFHYVPRGRSDSNIFVRTFMLGARTAFAQLCKRARRIIVNSDAGKKLLVERHGYPAGQVVVMEKADAADLLNVYESVAGKKKGRVQAKKRSGKRSRV